jgi:REP element-mobilizing transposase RayT
MGEPPRLTQILLPHDKAIIYFVTLCVEGRLKVLADPHVFAAIEATVAQLLRWRLLSGVVMPDHVHFVVTPTEERGLSVGDFASGFKRLLKKRIPAQDWEWQRGCFDRLLRSNESAQQKWIYVEQNPVRAGLVQSVADWPYFLGSIAEQGSWQLPLQKRDKGE